VYIIRGRVLLGSIAEIRLIHVLACKRNSYPAFIVATRYQITESTAAFIKCDLNYLTN
jgi:hypothetical protein